MRLAVGDIVVYRSHGAGPVTGRENKVILGERQEMIQLELAGGLRVELPLAHAQARLRPLATESDLARVGEVLRADQSVSGGTWLKRKKESLAKLNDGDPIGLAQIIRDNAPGGPAQTANGAKAPRSLWERD